MIARIAAHIRKELLLLLRDRAGLALLFVMPVCLVVIMAVVQDAPFRDFSDRQVKVLFADHDGGVVGQRIREKLERSATFTIADGSGMDADGFRESIRRGEHQVGVIVPHNASAVFDARSTAALEGIFAPADSSTGPLDSANVQLVIDPAVKHALRQLAHASITAILAELASERLLEDMHASLEEMNGDSMPPLSIAEPFIGVRQEMAARELAGDRVAYDSTQHNVPAWTVFAMFFTVVLLGGNMVKERSSGRMLRLLTMPGGTAERITGRISAYLLVCVAQGVLLLLVGIWLLPLIGLPRLRTTGPDALLLLLLAAIVVALAATSFGVLVGAACRTQQQSAVLGSTFVVIMSAIGGIWVPLYVMPPAMQGVGRVSPLHWSLEAFNVPLLREGDLGELLPCLVPLLIFSAVCIAISVVAERSASYR
ncbi:MAG: ABC transporter permease [Flavobacteriales bacterium]|nr:ABC transporter permease [Flavobacteriales bacterium]